nr:hypothetical protein [Tanacetum cinerariifolium]
MQNVFKHPGSFPGVRDVPWVDEKPLTDTGVLTKPTPVKHYCKPFNYKTGCLECPTCSWKNDGYCNRGNLPGTYIVGNSLHYQDYEWYEALMDSELKEQASRNKAIMEALISDDESINDGWRRWEIHEITYHDHDELEYENETHGERQVLCEAHELLVCNIRRFEMIKYSFGQDEEYVAVKKDEYDDLAITSDDACRAYQEIFRRMDEGWMVRMTKVIKGEFEKLKDLKVKDVLLTSNTSLEVFNNEFNRMSGMDDDLFTYKVKVANIPSDTNKDDDSKQRMSHEADDDMGYDQSDVAFTECDTSLEVFNNEFNRMSGMDDDLFTYKVKVANIPSDTNKDDDSKQRMSHEADDDMGYDQSDVAFTECWKNDGYCNRGNLPGAYIVGNSLHYQDYEWYEALMDSELKEQASRNKAIMEGLISDDESINDGWRRWEIHEITFEMIKYSFGQDEEYVAVKEDEYDDLAITRDDACRAYQEIFRRMDEGWMQKARILKLKQRYFEDYCSDNQYAVSIKEDMAYPCLSYDEVPPKSKNDMPLLDK